MFLTAFRVLLAVLAISTALAPLAIQPKPKPISAISPLLLANTSFPAISPVSNAPV